MKRTQQKDALRNIWKQKVSYLSIVIIAFLGVAAFLGLGYSAVAMKTNGSAFYNKLRFRDVEVISTRLLSADDLECLHSVEGVLDAEPVWQTDANAYRDTQRAAATVITLTERLNLPDVKEGRLPETDAECAIETRLADETGWKVGDVIDWLEMAEATGQYFLGADAFTITGLVEHPDHISLTVPESPYILVTRDTFDHEALKGCCMKALLAVDAADQNRFSRTYDDSVSPVTARIEDLAPERTVLRDEDVRAEGLEQVKAIDDLRIEVENVLADSRRQLDDGWQKLAEAEQEYASGLAVYETARKAYAAGLITQEPDGQHLEAARRSIDARRQELENGELEYADGAENVEYLAVFRDRAAAEVKALEPTRWIVLTGKGNAGFVQLDSVGVNLSSLQMTFSLLFVVIGALVIYATVSKMVDEQRTLVGVTKALGFFNREVFAKYLLFGLTAVILGTLFGILAAYFGLERFILKSYRIYFTTDLSRSMIALEPTLGVLLSGMALAACGVAFACLRQIRTPAIQLMQPRVPKGRENADRKGKHLLSLYSRLVLLNIRTDIKRVLVTVVSVAGCCALVVIGFTLRYSIIQGARNQYARIVAYDGRIQFDYGDDIEQKLRDAGVDYVPLYHGNVTFNITDTDLGELFCGDLAAVSDMFHLYDWETGEPLPSTDEGILIQRRMAEYNGIGDGDTFELSSGSLKPVRVRVAGIFENYAGRPMFMSPAYFEAVFGKAPVNNTFFVRFNGADREALLAELRDTLGFADYISAEEDGEIFDAATSVINATMVLLIFMAALMAGMVQMNLTNIYILQKKQELTIMRINGFTTREVIAYVTRETVFTTLAGIFLGLAAGSFLGYKIVRALEPSFVQLERSVCYPAWGYAAAITVFFTVVINAVCLKKVRHLKLTDIA